MLLITQLFCLEQIISFRYKNLFWTVLGFSIILLITADVSFSEGLPSLNYDFNNSLNSPVVNVNVDQIIENNVPSAKVDVPKVKSTSGYGLAVLYLGVLIISLIRYNL